MPVSTHPAWVRGFALFWALLFCLASTAQAAHLHGLQRSDVGHQLQAPAASTGTPGDVGGEEHCPLCVAMHSVLPAAMPVLQPPVLLRSEPVYAEVVLAGATAWHFPWFSRPPPAVR